jgi:cobalt-zinc-cadmium efflux system outer membrane protein
MSQALAELRRAEAELLALRAKSSFEVRQAYLAVVVALGEVALARETLGLAEQFHKTAVTQFQAGEVPQTEVVRAELELALAQRAVEDAEADVATARVSLGSLIAADPTAAWSIPAALPAPAPPPELDGLRKCVAARPELAAARAQIEASSAAAIGARRAGNPDFFAIGTLGHFDQGGVSARAGITFPLFDQGSLRANRRAAEAAIDENRALLADSQRTLALELDLAYARLTKARSRAVSIEHDQMPKAKKLLSMAQEAYQHGLGSYLELLDAQRAYNGVAATLLRARADYALALADVERAAGLPPAGGTP